MQAGKMAKDFLGMIGSIESQADNEMQSRNSYLGLTESH